MNDKQAARLLTQLKDAPTIPGNNSGYEEVKS